MWIDEKLQLGIGIAKGVIEDLDGRVMGGGKKESEDSGGIPLMAVTSHDRLTTFVAIPILFLRDITNRAYIYSCDRRLTCPGVGLSRSRTTNLSRYRLRW